MAAQNQKRESEQKASMAKRHADDMALLKQDLDKNKNLSDADKQKRIASSEKRYQEDAAFRESLKGMTPEQRTKAIKASMDKRHADDMALLKQDLDKNKNLSDADKKKQMDSADKRYKEDAAFRESLKGMTPEQSKAAIAAQDQKRESEQKASMAKRHADDMALLKQDLDKNKNLSDADKKKQMDAAEKQYQDNIAFWESLKGMTPEQRTKAIDERFKKR